MITKYFVEFIFYSFLGWVWESIFCTIKEKHWADRGFLFGPVCPIYGSCAVAATVIFKELSFFSSPDFPIWGIFLVCMVGSAIAEFSTSWVLEKRYHALWWDYSNLPLNIQGRICLPISICFGLAGVVIVKYLIPVVGNMHDIIPSVVYEILALVFALLFGADFALTQASLSSLLKDMEAFKQEFNAKAEQTYENISEMPKQLNERIAESVEASKESREERKENLRLMFESHAEKLTESQKHELRNIRTFRPRKDEEKYQGMALIEHVKNELKKNDKMRRKKNG